MPRDQKTPFPDLPRLLTLYIRKDSAEIARVNNDKNPHARWRSQLRQPANPRHHEASHRSPFHVKSDRGNGGPGSAEVRADMPLVTLPAGGARHSSRWPRGPIVPMVSANDAANLVGGRRAGGSPVRVVAADVVVTAVVGTMAGVSRQG